MGKGWALCVAFCLLPLMPPDDPKEEARGKIDSLLENRQWKDAAKAIKTYKRKHARSQEEKEEAENLLALAEGHRKIQSIQEEYARKKRARKCVLDLRKVIQKQGHVPEVKERAEELIDAARSTYVLVIEDFEDWADDCEEDEEIRDERRKCLVDDEKLVKHGDWAVRWTTGVGAAFWFLDSPTPNWAEYDYFCCWIFNEKVGKRPGYLEVEPQTASGHYFQALLPIDWVGWKEFRIPFKGKGGKFGKEGKASWDAIEGVWLDHHSWSGIGVDVIIDDIRLEKAVR